MKSHASAFVIGWKLYQNYFIIRHKYILNVKLWNILNCIKKKIQRLQTSKEVNFLMKTTYIIHLKMLNTLKQSQILNNCLQTMAHIASVSRASEVSMVMMELYVWFYESGKERKYYCWLSLCQERYSAHTLWAWKSCMILGLSAPASNMSLWARLKGNVPVQKSNLCAVKQSEWTKV